MNRRTIVLGAALVLAAAAASALAFADRPRGRKRARPRPPAPIVEPEPVVAEKGMPPGWDPHRFPPAALRRPPVALHVVVDPRVSGPLRELHEEAARRITAANPPSMARETHFAWVKGEGHTISGWGAQVEQVEQTSPGVYRVILSVVPHLEVSATLLDHVLEEYMIAHGQVHYIRTVEPPGTERG